jgi:tRNA dimethylallyltransferase
MKNSIESKVLFVVGPTGSGKSSVAMKLAKKIDGEIVCADSQTIRRDLDIGTAKPSKKDQLEIPHHMLDIIKPYEKFSVNQFKEMAEKVISDIHTRGNIPIIVGGTGLYIDALYYNFDISSQNKNPDYKNELENKTIAELQEIIHQKGYKLPTNVQNPRHLIGVILREGKTNKNNKPVSGYMIYGINIENEILKYRIKNRADYMLKNGLIVEVEKLLKKYGNPDLKIDAIGYPFIVDYLHGKISLEETRQKFAQGHWQYARKQKAWFKRNKNIHWSDSPEQLLEVIIKDIN